MPSKLLINPLASGIVQMQFLWNEVEGQWDQHLLEETREAIFQLSQDPTLSVLILTGSGTQWFSGGYDPFFLAQQKAKDPLQFAVLAQEVGKALEKTRLITIAQLNGSAQGLGAEIALACDLIYAATHAKFGFSMMQFGLNPGMGGVMRLLKQVGLFQAKDLVFSGRLIHAQEAYGMGLFNGVENSTEALFNKVLQVAQDLHANGAEVLSEMKKMMQEFTETHGLHFKVDAEVQVFARLFESFRQAVLSKKWSQSA